MGTVSARTLTSLASCKRKHRPSKVVCVHDTQQQCAYCQGMGERLVERSQGGQSLSGCPGVMSWQVDNSKKSLRSHLGHSKGEGAQKGRNHQGVCVLHLDDDSMRSNCHCENRCLLYGTNVGGVTAVYDAPLKCTVSMGLARSALAGLDCSSQASDII